MLTYLNTLVRRRFLTLYTRSELPKNNMVDYYPDVFGLEQIPEEQKVTAETASTLLEKRETLMEVITIAENDLEFAIVRDLVVGESLSAMEKKHKVSRAVLVSVIKRIEKIMKDSKDEAA